MRIMVIIEIKLVIMEIIKVEIITIIEIKRVMMWENLYFINKFQVKNKWVFTIKFLSNSAYVNWSEIIDKIRLFPSLLFLLSRKAREKQFQKICVVLSRWCEGFDVRNPSLYKDDNIFLSLLGFVALVQNWY